MSGLGNINDFIEENNHGGLIEENADFYSTTEMPIEENVIVKKVKQPKVWDWKKSIGRALMSGYHTDYILNKYGLLINQSPNKEKILKYLRVNDGLLGYLFVDTSVSHFTVISFSIQADCTPLLPPSTDRHLNPHSLTTLNDFWQER